MQGKGSENVEKLERKHKMMQKNLKIMTNSKDDDE